MIKETRSFSYIVVCLLLVITFRGAFSVVASDDAFITFRYSENIASGKGFVYNEDQRILGTSTPLFALVLASLRLLGLDVVLMSHVLSILFHFVISLLILLILKEAGYYLAGVIASFCFALDTLVLTAYGMETNLYISLFLLSFYFLIKRKALPSVVFASLMTFCRADGSVWLLILFIIMLLRFREGLAKAIVTATAILLPWFSFSFFYFGSLLPHTVSVKILNVSFLHNSFISAVPFYVKEFYSYFILIALLGVLISFKHREQLFLLFVFDFAYLTVFALLKAQHSHWYFIPLVPSIYIFFARASEEFINACFKLEEKPEHRTFGKVFLAIPAILVILFSAKTVLNLDKIGVADARSKASYYKKTGLWLNKNTPKGSKIMVGEIGIIGYYSGREIVDMGGLVTPLDDLKEKTPGEIASNFRPDYYIGGIKKGRRDIVLGESVYELVAETEGNMGIYKRSEHLAEDDFPTAKKMIQ